MTTGAHTPTPTRRPRRPRTWLPLAVAAWLVLEIWLLTLVADAAGGFAVFLLIVAGVVLGAAVVKRAGRRAFRKLSETLQRQPGAAAPEGRYGEGNGLTMLGGLLLMIPGLISDAVGLILLLPPVQKVVRRRVERAVDRHLRQAGAAGGLGDAFQQARIHRPDGKVVQGEVIRDDKPGDTPHEPRTPLP